MKSNPYKSGLLAETMAIILLTLKFYRVIERRYKTKVGEIDIIALRGKNLVFIEVKKRRNKAELFESITSMQQKRIVNAAEIFLSKNSHFYNYNKRFDAILISQGALPIHLENAWQQV